MTQKDRHNMQVVTSTLEPAEKYKAFSFLKDAAMKYCDGSSISDLKVLKKEFASTLVAPEHSGVVRTNAKKRAAPPPSAKSPKKPPSSVDTYEQEGVPDGILEQGVDDDSEFEDCTPAETNLAMRFQR